MANANGTALPASEKGADPNAADDSFDEAAEDLQTAVITLKELLLIAVESTGASIQTQTLIHAAYRYVEDVEAVYKRLDALLDAAEGNAKGGV
jgi:hypothetical protein